MSQRIHLAAMVLRDGQLLLVRDDASAPWELPGGELLPEHEDADLGMDAILSAMGVEVPAIEEDFIETVYLPGEGGPTIYNLYAPSDWTGEPRPARAEHGWFAPLDLEELEMFAPVREAVLAAFGLRAPREDGERILAAVSGAAGLGGPAAAGGSLDATTTTLMSAAVLAALGHREAMRARLREAIRHGATAAQVAEMLSLVGASAGAGAAEEAAPVAAAVLAEHGLAWPGVNP